MTDLLQNFISIIGVEGAYICDLKGKIIESIPYEGYKESLIWKIIDNFIRSVGTDFDINLSRIELFGSNKIVIIVLTEKYNFLGFFDKSSNFNLINQEIEDLISKIKLL